MDGEPGIGTAKEAGAGLAGLWAAVAARCICNEAETSFAAYYRKINQDDESAFTAKMPSIGKLGFDVDFYGRGHFTPGAYPSASRQPG